MTCRAEVLVAVIALQARNGGQPVIPVEIVNEMTRSGGRYAESTVRTHVTTHMCSNAANPQWSDLRRVDRGLYVLAASGPQGSVTSAHGRLFRGCDGGAGRRKAPLALGGQGAGRIR